MILAPHKFCHCHTPRPETMELVTFPLQTPKMGNPKIVYFTISTYVPLTSKTWPGAVAQYKE